MALLDASAKPLATYTYDAVGRRTQKNVINGAVTTATGFVYDGGGVIEERNGAGGVVGTLTQDCPDIRKSLNALDYNCGDHVSRVNVGAQTVPMKNLGGLLRRGGTNYWPHTDADGSTVALTLDNGTVAERYEYADFGEPQFLNASGATISSSAVGSAYLFGGIQYDSESGLYVQRRKLRNMRKEMAREMTSLPQILDPRTGTTLQRDVGDPAGGLVTLIALTNKPAAPK